MTDQLAHRVDALIKAYKALMKERTSLIHKLDSKESEISALKEEIGTLKMAQRSKGLNQALGKGDKESLRQELDTVIGEIDKIIRDSEG